MKLAAARLASTSRLVRRIGGVFGPPSSADPSASLHVAGGRIGGVFGPRIEGDRCFRRRLVDDVHNRLEQRQAFRWNPEAATDHHTVVRGALQRFFKYGAAGRIGGDHACIAFPTSFLDLCDRDGDAGVDLFSIEAGRQGRVRKVDGFGLLAYEQDAGSCGFSIQTVVNG
jgi:hypothetical protein